MTLSKCPSQSPPHPHFCQWVTIHQPSQAQNLRIFLFLDSFSLNTPHPTHQSSQKSLRCSRFLRVHCGLLSNLDLHLLTDLHAPILAPASMPSHHPPPPSASRCSELRSPTQSDGLQSPTGSGSCPLPLLVHPELSMVGLPSQDPPEHKL